MVHYHINLSVVPLLYARPLSLGGGTNIYGYLWESVIFWIIYRGKLAFLQIWIFQAYIFDLIFLMKEYWLYNLN